MGDPVTLAINYTRRPDIDTVVLPEMKLPSVEHFVNGILANEDIAWAAGTHPDEFVESYMMLLPITF